MHKIPAAAAKGPALSATPGRRPLPQRNNIIRAAIGIGLYAGAFGATFGALAVGVGLTVAQAMTLSLVMFTGASQFAFIGIVTAGGSPFAAIPAALLLGVRNAFYGVPISTIVSPRGAAKLWTAHLVIDETTALAVAQDTPPARRYAFWTMGVILFTLWNGGTLAGAVLGAAVDAEAFGLDAAAPAVLLALLWPQLRAPRAPLVAFLGAGVAAALIPVAPAGVPVIAAAVVAAAAGLGSGGSGGGRDDDVAPS